MINLDLAKKLKDAGYEQPTTPLCGHSHYCRCGNIIRRDEMCGPTCECEPKEFPTHINDDKAWKEIEDKREQWEQAFVFIPTTDDLIEALRDELKSLSEGEGQGYLSLQIWLDHVQANGEWSIVDPKSETGYFRRQLHKTGNSPAEALARLWLAIKEGK